MKQKKGIAIHKLEAQTGICFRKLPHAVHIVANTKRERNQKPRKNMNHKEAETSTLTETMYVSNE